MSWVITGSQKEGDPNWADVSLLINGNGSNGSKAIFDSSPTPKTITVVNNAQISTTNGRAAFGGSSVFFGSGASGQTGEVNPLSVPDSSDLRVTAGADFTVEAWVYLTTNATFNYIISKGGATTREWAFAVGPTNLNFYWSTNGASAGDQTITRAATLPLNTWMHVAAVKEASTIRLYKDGVQAGADGTFTSIYSGTGTLFVGRFMDYTNINHGTIGYLDDIRISRRARYSATFTPPTAQFPDPVPRS